MNRTLLWAAIALLPLAACSETQKTVDTGRAMAQAQVTPTLSSSDAGFITGAARGGIAEVQLGQLAAKQGGTAAVKRFGQRMVTDHSRINDQLTALAQQKQITPPTSMGADQQALYDRLAKLRGRAFDRMYDQAMVQDHQQDIQAFQTEAQGGTDADVKAFAANTLPTLQQHLDMARRLPSR
jgi:putative membrane protein